MGITCIYYCNNKSQHNWGSQNLVKEYVGKDDGLSASGAILDVSIANQTVLWEG